MKKTKNQNPYLKESMDVLAKMQFDLNVEYKKLVNKRLKGFYLTNEEKAQFDQVSTTLLLVRHAIKEKSF